jgi:hypothetical protein
MPKENQQEIAEVAEKTEEGMIRFFLFKSRAVRLAQATVIEEEPTGGNRS